MSAAEPGQLMFPYRTWLCLRSRSSARSTQLLWDGRHWGELVIDNNRNQQQHYALESRNYLFPSTHLLTVPVRSLLLRLTALINQRQVIKADLGLDEKINNRIGYAALC